MDVQRLSSVGGEGYLSWKSFLKTELLRNTIFGILIPSQQVVMSHIVIYLTPEISPSEV